MLDQILWFLAGLGILFALVFLWFLTHYWLNPILEEPDGEARITGPCGDTMDIRLQFKEGRVVNSSFWTNGCSHSLNCVCTAADLAKGKEPDEIIGIDAEIIQESIGGFQKIRCIVPNWLRRHCIRPWTIICCVKNAVK